jgi:four helix bundle protein
MPTFEDLRAFQHAMDLMVEIYRSTSHFPKHELYGLSLQMRRAACSIVSNIAEAQGRLTLGERRLFLSQARGSLYEVEAQLIAAQRLELADELTVTRLRRQARIAARELYGLILWVRKREAPANRPTAPELPEA